MTSTITKEYAEELLYDLLLEHRITHRDVDYCFIQHKNEIKDMISIFDHKNNKNQQLVLALLNILAKDQGDKVMAYYSREHALSVKPDFSRESVKLLLAACLKNQPFFSYALRLCKRIESKLEKSEDNKETRFFTILERNAAAPQNDSFKDFFPEPVPITYNGISGKLSFIGNRYKQAYLECVFDKPQDTIPFEVELYYTTTRDGNKGTMVAKNPVYGEKGKIVAIRSEFESGIDYSGGIEARYDFKATD